MQEFEAMEIVTISAIARAVSLSKVSHASLHHPRLIKLARA